MSDKEGAKIHDKLDTPVFQDGFSLATPVKGIVNNYGHWGGGGNRGHEIFWRNWGAQNGWRFTKTFWVILPQICISILWHDQSMKRTQDFFMHSRIDCKNIPYKPPKNVYHSWLQGGSKGYNWCVCNAPFTLDEGSDTVWLPLKYFITLLTIWHLKGGHRKMLTIWMAL